MNRTQLKRRQRTKQLSDAARLLAEEAARKRADKPKPAKKKVSKKKVSKKKATRKR